MIVFEKMGGERKKSYRKNKSQTKIKGDQRLISSEKVIFETYYLNRKE